MVNITDFKLYFVNILKMLLNRPKCKLIIVGICPTSTKMENRYIGINQQIAIYNNVYKSVVDNQSVFYIDMENYIKTQNTNEYLLPDDHHLNKNGNLLVSKLILQLINAFILNNEGVEMYNNSEQEEALNTFYESFRSYPKYSDNVYNLISLAHMLKSEEIKKEVIEYAKMNFIEDKDIYELLLQVT